MPALLDVNVLIALLDAQHIHHLTVVEWFNASGSSGWATCPLTENGFVRILMQPNYPGSAQFTAAALISLLRQATSHPNHEFWLDEITLRDGHRFNPGEFRGPSQITDAYLLGLAVHRGGKLVTLDRDVRLAAVPAARPNHVHRL